MNYGFAAILCNNNFQAVSRFTDASYLLSVKLGGKAIPDTLHKHEFTEINLYSCPEMKALCSVSSTESRLFPQHPNFTVLLIQVLIVATFNLSTELDEEPPAPIVIRLQDGQYLHRRLSSAVKAGLDLKILRNKLASEGLTEAEYLDAMNKLREGGY